MQPSKGNYYKMLFNFQIIDLYVCMYSVISSSTYEQSPLPRSKSSGSSHKFIVLESCAKGDLVFVVWSMRHGQFMVVQDSPSLYFVHGDSLGPLNLRLPQPGEEPTIPMPYYAIGRVVEKEYCQARKVYCGDC